jgi:hypothetical protein
LHGGSEGKTHGISVKVLSLELKTVANEVVCCASFIFPPRMTALFANEAVANLWGVRRGRRWVGWRETRLQEYPRSEGQVRGKRGRVE